MAYVYTRVEDLEKTDKVGSKQCVALVQRYALAPHTSRWRAGAAVLGNKTLVKGTAIATFEGGRYLSHRHGNHAAFFVRHDGDGFWIMDQ